MAHSRSSPPGRCTRRAGGHARGRVPVLELRGLIDRDARPDQVTRVARQPRRRQSRQLPRRSFQSHRYVPSSACIRCGPWCPASSASDQQFAFTPGDSADRYQKATSTLRRCASTRPSTVLTCASTPAVQSATSSMLADAAVSLLFSSTKQAARHGRLRLQARSSRPQPDSITHRDHVGRSVIDTASLTWN